MPNALIIRTAGTNCDVELAHAFERAGATPIKHHLNEVIAHPELIKQADLIGFAGGFSYGDDIAAGRIFANRVKHRLTEALLEAVKSNVPMIGICNGFQVLVKIGFLPDPTTLQAGGPAKQTVTLADNTSGRFVDEWVGMTVPSETKCIWTRGLENFDLPIAHGEGRFVVDSESTLQQLKDNGQIAFRYAVSGTPGVNFHGNPNGSVDGIAGICDPTGTILGLMPHPERYTHATNHPHWTRLPELASETPAGLRLFENAVAFVNEKEAKNATDQFGESPIPTHVQ